MRVDFVFEDVGVTLNTDFSVDMELSIAAVAAAARAEAAAERAETAAANLETDTTLSVSGKAADAKVTGDKINNLILNTGQAEVTGWNDGKNVLLRTSITSVNISTDIVDQVGYSCVILPCTEGDIFYVTSKGASGARNWAFLSSDGSQGENNIISRAVAGSNNYWYENYKLVAPAKSQYVVFNAYTGNTRKVIKGEYLINIVNRQTRKISILFVGNSLTQDGISYLPYMLKTYYPEIDFRFYMWYHGGWTLTEHYNDFVSNQVAKIFSVAENTSDWTNYNEEKTMAWVLDNYQFDIVCLQGYYNYTPTTNPAKPTDDVTAFNNCRNYIQSNYEGGNPLEFITLFHAPLRSDADTVFNRTKQWNETLLKETIAQDMIPMGIAIYRALTTDLDDLGDSGHLSLDGTHAQEGLPCLLQTFTAMCWLFDKLSINKSVYGSTMRMTTQIYNSINVPGANLGTGVITGTDAQNLLAQEIAIKAYKEGKYIVNANLFDAT